MAEIHTLTIESDADDEAEEIEIPKGAVDILSDGQTPSEMAGDLVMLGFAQQLHAGVYHSDEATSDELTEANETLEELFEERFGSTFEEMAGHSH